MIKIRSDFLRIARAFTYGATGEFTIMPTDRCEVLKSVYVEPARSGQGVTIVSSDGSALCLQHDAKGTVDREYLISGFTERHITALSGATINDRWFKVRKKGPYVEMANNIQIALAGVTMRPTRTFGDQGSTGGDVFVYPNWRKIVPSRERLADMKPGFPGILNAAYLNIIGRLHDDGATHVRDAFIRYEEQHSGQVAVFTFPWRPHMVVVVAAMNGDKDRTDEWLDRTTRVIEGDSDETPDDEDPTAGL